MHGYEFVHYFRNYGGTKVRGDFNQTIQMKFSKFYSMMTVHRFEQQTDVITVIAPFYTVIINQNLDCFNFLKKSFQFPVLFKIIIVLSTMTYQTPLGHGQ